MKKFSTTTSHIIFLSYGNPYYLPYVLSQCKATNPNATVHLIGDASNVGYKGVTHHFISDYNANATEFQKHYVHLSTNNAKFECFCFERWFIIDEFIRKNAIKNVAVLDTDILVYEDIFKYYSSFENCKMTLYIDHKGFSASPNLTFLQDVGILSSFCNFTRSAYIKKNEDYSKAEQHYKMLQSECRHGGVCDMTLFYLFYLSNTHLIFDLHNTINDKVYYDANYLTVETPNFTLKKSESGGKHIDWENGIPYGYIEDTNKKIKFPVLHFQGDQKKYIPEMVTKKGFIYWYNLKYIPLKNKLKSLFRG